jgi:hypothetical protein
MKKPQSFSLQDGPSGDDSGIVDLRDVSANAFALAPVDDATLQQGQRLESLQMPVATSTFLAASPGSGDFGVQAQIFSTPALVGTTANAPVAQAGGAAGGDLADSTTNSAASFAAGAAVTRTQDMSIASAVGAQLAQQMFGVTGAGITIGVISNSFNSPLGKNLNEFATAVANGSVDPNAVFTAPLGKDDPTTTNDNEGLAMAEVIHEIAPNAHIIFYTADQGTAPAINQLTADKCNVICDDISNLSEPFYQPGKNAQTSSDAALTVAVANGISYFTCAINTGATSYYENQFIASNVIQNAQLPNGTAAFAYNFGGSGNSATPFELINAPNFSFSVDLQWEQPFGNSQYTLQWFLYTNNNGTPGSLVASGVTDGSNSDPVRQTAPGGNVNKGQYFLSIAYLSGTVPANEAQFKIIMDNNSNTPVAFESKASGQLDPKAGVGSGSVWGHNENPNAITVGAIDYHNTPAFGGTLQMEQFSASGHGEYLFDANGNLLATPQTLGKIDISAPDQGPTDEILNPFGGTSAATPAAAAIGALLLQADHSLTPTDIKYLLKDSSTFLTGGQAVPSQSGAGLVQAQLAVRYAVGHVINASASQPFLYGTHLGGTFVGGPGSHLITGTGGFNTLTYGGATSGVTLTFGLGGTGSTAAGKNGYGGTDSFADIQQFIGSPNGSNNMQGGGNGYIFHAGGGSGYIADTGVMNQAFSDGGNVQLFFVGTQNQLFGGGGTDWLGVSGNNNALVGGMGNDFINASGSSNTLVGGSGNPTLFVVGTGNVLHAGSGQDWEGVSGNQNQIFGGPGADWMGATGTNNAISGGSGASTLFANGNSNTLSGSAGNDWIGVSGKGNFLYGGSGNCFIAATGSSNTLNPNGGGTDTLFAAANAHDHDTFVYHPGYGNVTINNFVPQVGDVINFAGWGISNVSQLAPFVSTSADGSIVLNLSGSSHLTLEGIPGGLQDSWFNFHA